MIRELRPRRQPPGACVWCVRRRRAVDDGARASLRPACAIGVLPGGVPVEAGCPNDYLVDEVTRQFLLAGDVKWVSVARPEGPGSSYRVSLQTLTKLVRHEQVDVPAGYEWTAFPFIVTVEDGRTVGIDQYWVP